MSYPATSRSDPNAPTKLVIRRLPPELTQSMFESTIEKYAHLIEWSCYFEGKIPKSRSKEIRFSRAYLSFRDPKDMLAFGQAYAGQTFYDSKGRGFPAWVEAAPFQRVITKRKKPDPRMNSIESEPMYIAFLESLNKPQDTTKSTSAISTSKPTGDASRPTTTPLLESLKARKAKSKAEFKSDRKARRDADTRRDMAPSTTIDVRSTNEKQNKSKKEKRQPPSQPKESIASSTTSSDSKVRVEKVLHSGAKVTLLRQSNTNSEPQGQQSPQPSTLSVDTILLKKRQNDASSSAESIPSKPLGASFSNESSRKPSDGKSEVSSQGGQSRRQRQRNKNASRDPKNNLSGEKKERGSTGGSSNGAGGIKFSLTKKT